MKILFPTASFSKRGAVSKYAVELSTRFAKDHEVHVLTSYQDIKVPGVTVHKIPMPFWPHYFKVGLNALKNAHYCKKLKAKHGIDIVHSQGGESLYQDVLKAPSCHKAAVELYMSERDWKYRLLKPFEPATRIVNAIEKYNYGSLNFKKTIIMAKGTIREIKKYYDVPDEYIANIPNGVNIEEFTPDNREKYRQDIRKKHGISESDKVLLFVGWEFKRKGLAHIIDSLPHIDEKVKLLVVGGDNRGRYICQAKDLGVKDQVIFAGHSNEVRKYYASADLFVFPTDYESFSMATLESAASGLPLLATKVNGTEELIKDGVNGFFIKRDGKDIAEKVNKALSDNLRKKMSKKARESTIDHSWDNIAKLTLEMYEGLD